LPFGGARCALPIPRLNIFETILKRIGMINWQNIRNKSQIKSKTKEKGA